MREKSPYNLAIYMVSPLEDPFPSLHYILLLLFSINPRLLLSELHIIDSSKLVNVLFQYKTSWTRVVTHHSDEGNKNSKEQLDKVMWIQKMYFSIKSHEYTGIRGQNRIFSPSTQSNTIPFAYASKKSAFSMTFQMAWNSSRFRYASIALDAA
jgi:hypothetical protein